MFNQNFDFEVTNRCNADCSFCPRDATPHQGLMREEVFDQALLRAVEMHELFGELELGGKDVDTITLCGLGEPLLHKKLPTFVRRSKEAGFRSRIASNGSLLSGAKGDALLEAGLDQITINISDLGDAYEEVYKLPWQKTLDSVTEFAAKAGDACEVHIALVNHHADQEHLDAMKRFWRERGITKFRMYNELINRGGALELDYMDFDAYEEVDEAFLLFERRGRQPMCGVPFFDNFVGYDGNVYLCCQDWRKQAPVGNVFDTSWAEITRNRLEAVASREPVCRECSVDPVNSVALRLRREKEGRELDRPVKQVVNNRIMITGTALKNAELLAPGSTENLPEPVHRPQSRPLIPVRAL